MIATELLPDTIPLCLENIEITETVVVLRLTSQQTGQVCPDCGHGAPRVHSCYPRTLADLPWGKREVKLVIGARRFFCDQPACRRRTFVEPLRGLAAPRARRSDQLAERQRQLGLANGGEAGARLSRRLSMPTSADTILRLVRRTPEANQPTPPLRVIGVDDWAYRRGQGYGTLLIDHERGRPVDLLPDREPKSLIDWLQRHPGIQLITRDRAQVYIDALTAGAPQAQQVADRFHLLQNLREALERFFDRHPAELKQVRLSRDPAAPTASEPQNRPDSAQNPRKLKRRPLKGNSQVLQQRAGRRAQRQARFDEVHALARQGHSHRQIARQLKLARPTVKRWLATDQLPRPRGHPETSKAEPWADYLRSRWQSGCHSPRQLWHELRAQGYAGSEPGVWRWLLRLREGQAEGGPILDVRPRLPPTVQTYSLSSRQAAWVLVRPPEQRKPDEQVWLDQMPATLPAVSTAEPLAQQFVTMVKDKRRSEFDTWLEAAEDSGVRELRNFATGLRGDYAAVVAGLSLKWSNGPTEGHINRLKLLKRSMYGRAKFDLLRLRVLHAN